jgi:hypothetical protein
MTAHGSNKRRRRVTLAARFNDQEAAAVREMAERHGQSVGTMLRKTLLGIPFPVRSVRRPTVDAQLAAKMMAGVATLTGAVNKVGSNINQIAKEDNMGRDLRLNSLIAEWHEFKELFDRDQMEIRRCCMQALGFEPDRKIED